MKKSLYYLVLISFFALTMIGFLSSAALAERSSIYPYEHLVTPAPIKPTNTPNPCRRAPCTPLEMEQWNQCKAQALCDQNQCLKNALLDLLQNFLLSLPVGCECALGQALVSVMTTCTENTEPEAVANCIMVGIAPLFVTGGVCAAEHIPGLGQLLSAIMIAVRSLEFSAKKEKCYLEYIHDIKLCEPGCASLMGDYDDDSSLPVCQPVPSLGSCKPLPCP